MHHCHSLLCISCESWLAVAPMHFTVFLCGHLVSGAPMKESIDCCHFPVDANSRLQVGNKWFKPCKFMVSGSFTCDLFSMGIRPRGSSKLGAASGSFHVMVFLPKGGGSSFQNRKATDASYPNPPPTGPTARSLHLFATAEGSVKESSCL